MKLNWNPMTVAGAIAVALGQIFAGTPAQAITLPSNLSLSGVLEAVGTVWPTTLNTAEAIAGARARDTVLLTYTFEPLTQLPVRGSVERLQIEASMHSEIGRLTQEIRVLEDSHAVLALQSRPTSNPLLQARAARATALLTGVAARLRAAAADRSTLTRLQALLATDATLAPTDFDQVRTYSFNSARVIRGARDRQIMAMQLDDLSRNTSVRLKTVARVGAEGWARLIRFGRPALIAGGVLGAVGIGGYLTLGDVLSTQAVQTYSTDPNASVVVISNR